MLSLSRRAFLVTAALCAPVARLWAQSPSTSLDDFLYLSSRLLERPTLDRDLAQVYLTALNNDRDSAATLAILAQMNGNPTPEQRVLMGTIVEWWYTGVYEVRGEPRVATHTGALMWSALSMPAPGTCAGPFGAWSRPPA